MDKKLLIKKLFNIFVTSLFILYLFVCFTPLPNYLAKPFLAGKQPVKADVIIVLSGGVYGNRSLSWFSMERLLYGLKLFQNKYAGNIILSGGSRTNKDSDAQAMSNFLEGLGFDKQYLILEENSQNTFENLIETSKIMEKKGYKKAIVISSSVHTKRVSQIINKLNTRSKIELILVAVPFYDDYRQVISDRIVLFHYTLREIGAIIYYKIQGFI